MSRHWAKRNPAREWCTFRVGVTLIATVALAWNYDRTDQPPDSDPQARALFDRSWILQNDGWRRWCCTLYRDRVEARILGPDGTPTHDLGDSNIWDVDCKPGTLDLTERYGMQKERHRYLIRSLTSDSLVLEPEIDGRPTGKQLIFTGRPRVSRTHDGPPFWLFVFIQFYAAMLAHGVAKTRVTRFGRFNTYLGMHMVVAIVLSPMAYLYPEKGFLAGLNQMFFVIATIGSGLLLGLVGGIIHLRRPQPTQDGMYHDDERSNSAQKAEPTKTKAYAPSSRSRP